MENREGQKYRVASNEKLEIYNIKVGDECVMSLDDGSDRPRFYNEKWSDDGKWYIDMKKVELIEERPERYASREVKIDPVVTSVMTQFLERSQLGISKYGTTLEDNNTDDFLQHLKEELMDATLYIETLQREKIKRLKDCK